MTEKGWKKVNEFERDLSHSQTSINANIQYTVPSLKVLSDDNYMVLGRIIASHMSEQAPRLAQLYNYYENNNEGISKGRRNEAWKEGADNRPSHPFASLITDFHTTYSVGKPVKVNFHTVDDTTDEQNNKLQELDHLNDTDTLNYQLYSDMGKYGRAYEQVFYDGENIRYARLDPFKTFIIYSTDIIPKPLMSVRYIAQPLLGGDAVAEYLLDLYTDTGHYTMQMNGQGSNLTLIKAEENALDTIPVIEYENNTERTGDFEKVIPLIDLYDAAQADTSNYMQDYVNALLVIKGDLDAFSTDDADHLIQGGKFLALKTGKDVNGASTDIDVEYLTKSMDSSSSELYKSRVASDIYTFSKTPNYVDGDFSSNSSGVALKYRMLATVTLAEVKRHEFSTGLMNRYRLVTKLLKGLAEINSKWDIEKLDISYTDNVPLDEATIINNFIALGGQVSEETKLNYVQGILVQDVPDELKRLESQEEDYGDWINSSSTESVDNRSIAVQEEANTDEDDSTD